jgi:hypothetical protein
MDAAFAAAIGLEVDRLERDAATLRRLRTELFLTGQSIMDEVSYRHRDVDPGEPTGRRGLHVGLAGGGGTRSNSAGVPFPTPRRSAGLLRSYHWREDWPFALDETGEVATEVTIEEG